MKIPNLNFDENIIKGIDYDTEIISSALTAAGEYVKEHEELLPFDAVDVSPSGAHFVIPVVVPEEVYSGDARIFEAGSVLMRNLPLPLMWQEKTGPGHDGSFVVGRIDSIENTENGLVNARGVFDVGIYGREAERLVRGKFLRGVSVDLDKFVASVEELDQDDETIELDDLSSKDKSADKGEKKIKTRQIKNEKTTVEEARLMAITIVAKPAFQECFILIEDDPALSSQIDYTVDDGVYEDIMDEMDNSLATLAASAAPVVPPTNWFSNPKLNSPTPLTIDDDGKVFGHIAAWHVDHIGLPRATKPPRSATNYAYFRTGVVRTEDGTDVQVGQLTLSGGHASLHASAADAVKHYDDTASAVADVSAGEDQFGIWVAGALRPEATATQVRALRASAPSGDWRPIGGRLELVAVCQVNVPGFPVARSIVAGGQIQALVAAGAAPLAEIRESLKDNTINSRLEVLEMRELSLQREAAMAIMADAKAEQTEELKAMAASASARMADATTEFDAELAAKVEELKQRFNN